MAVSVMLPTTSGYGQQKLARVARSRHASCAIAFLLISHTLAAETNRSEEPADLTAACFRTTHNSFSGGSRGTIIEQLNAGVRGLELDVYADDVASVGDFRIGHGHPGDEVALGGGNPDKVMLKDWLETINSWSDQHPKHAPLFLVLDLKGGEIGSAIDCVSSSGGFSAKHLYKEGDFARLNNELIAVFGPKLYKAEHFQDQHSWPTVESLRGRILVILSGDQCARRQYVYDTGDNPAIAANASGHLVEIHDSGTGKLWYWTGVIAADGQIKWLRHGYYDQGKRASVTINDDGWIIEVHEAVVLPELFYNIGRLDSDGDIRWLTTAGVKFDHGVEPTIRFITSDSYELKEIHRSEWNQNRWGWTARLDSTSPTLKWSKNVKTDEAQFQKDHSICGDETIRVASGFATVPKAITVSLGGRDSKLIRFEQIAFTESQKDDSQSLAAFGSVFFAMAASEAVSFKPQLPPEILIRYWQFDEAAAKTATDHSVKINFPATDYPSAKWYDSYCKATGVTQ